MADDERDSCVAGATAAIVDAFRNRAHEQPASGHLSCSQQISLSQTAAARTSAGSGSGWLSEVQDVLAGLADDQVPRLVQEAKEGDVLDLLKALQHACAAGTPKGNALCLSLAEVAHARCFTRLPNVCAQMLRPCGCHHLSTKASFMSVFQDRSQNLDFEAGPSVRGEGGILKARPWLTNERACNFVQVCIREPTATAGRRGREIFNFVSNQVRAWLCPRSCLLHAPAASVRTYLLSMHG